MVRPSYSAFCWGGRTPNATVEFVDSILEQTDWRVPYQLPFAPTLPQPITSLLSTKRAQSRLHRRPSFLNQFSVWFFGYPAMPLFAKRKNETLWCHLNIVQASVYGDVKT